VSKQKPPVVNAILRGVYFKENPVNLDKGKYENRLELLKVPRLTKDRILRVAPERTGCKIYNLIVKPSDPSGAYGDYVELDFLADAITIIIYDKVSDENPMESLFFINYLYEKRYSGSESGDVVGALYDLYAPTGSYTETHVDIRPFNNFKVGVWKYGWALEEGMTVKLIFSQQKKTKISDISYDESVFNGITHVGLSKNVFRDVIETLSPTSHNHNLNDLAEKLHASLAEITANQHHTETFVATGVYTGNNANNRQITGLGFNPKYMIILEDRGGGTCFSWFKSDTMAQWQDYRITLNLIYNTGHIDLITDGFEVDNADPNNWLNINGFIYHWVAWG